MALSKPMREALTKLAAVAEASAYELRARLDTLHALEMRGLIAGRQEIGAGFFPHTSIKWRITDTGRAAV